MRLFHSRLTLCVLVTLGVVYYGASATPLKSHNHTKEGISQRATLRHEPNWYGRGRMDDFGNCVAARHRGEGKDGPRRKVRIRPDNKQHTATTPPSQNSAQKHTSDKEIEQPVQAEKTSNPITSTIQEETKEESPSSAATTSTSTIESAAPSTQTTDSGGSHNNVPEVSAPSLKSDQVGIPVGGNMVSQDMQNELVRLHNALRGANGQGDVQWDDKLARYSAGWMNKCRWEHSGGYKDKNIKDGYGENLGMTSDSKLQSARDMVTGWAHEQSKYHCRQASSDKEFMGFGHYTAMMWKEVEYIGCSLQSCSSISNDDFGFGKGGWIWSCNYWPVPNMGLTDVDNYKINVPCSKVMPHELQAE